ncbi:MAG TPA: class I SAM-dependent methyltransferase [Roseiflexaceae bacterium]|nr:class I SAM-dependent methyltransferase [Roseiflexaceae bacterium]
MDQTYFNRLAAAFVRGKLQGEPAAEAHLELFTRPLDQLAGDELQGLIQLGLASDLRLHKFKRTLDLARVRSVLGILRALQPAELLDIGSGRGAFLWPLLDAYPGLPVTAVDLLERRVADIEAVRRGGVDQVRALHADATTLEFSDGSFDVVTMLEVLEHIPATARALAEVCRVARRALVLSVPSKPDNNPEHVHLFDQASLTARLREAGAERVNVSYVHNHMIVVASLANSVKRKT